MRDPQLLQIGDALLHAGESSGPAIGVGGRGERAAREPPGLSPLGRRIGLAQRTGAGGPGPCQHDGEIPDDDRQLLVLGPVCVDLHDQLDEPPQMLLGAAAEGRGVGKVPQGVVIEARPRHAQQVGMRSLGPLGELPLAGARCEGLDGPLGRSMRGEALGALGGCEGRGGIAAAQVRMRPCDRAPTSADGPGSCPMDGGAGTVVVGVVGCGDRELSDVFSQRSTRVGSSGNGSGSPSTPSRCVCPDERRGHEVRRSLRVGTPPA